MVETTGIFVMNNATRQTEPEKLRTADRKWAPAALLLAIAIAFAVGNAPPASAFQVFATGLNNPRGLKFGPDGNLYVAEGGAGGTSINTIGQCDQVVSPVGPYTTDGPSARILKIDSGANVTVVADELPSSQTALGAGGFVSGVADVAFIGNTLYAILAGAGCSHAVASTDNAVLRVNGDGTTTQIADLSQFQKSHPVAFPNADDFEPDGTWYSMVALKNQLFAVEPNHGEVDRISLNGSIKRIVDVSAAQGHIVPTALAYNGRFALGNLGVFPSPIGNAVLFQFPPSGKLNLTHISLSKVLGVAFDSANREYALETSHSDATGGFPAPFAGDVVRINADGSTTTIDTGLMFPTAMTFGPDGKLYVSNFGFGGGPGDGEIVTITTP
jgi:hypothetical protein